MNLTTLRNLDFGSLPGYESQKMYEPPYRSSIMPKTYSAKKAAILFLIYRDNKEWKIPCILRNTYKGVHSNQIGFPGGKPEVVDENLQATAIREAYEEIKAEPKSIEILGELTPLYIPPSNFEVHPFVGIYHSKDDFELDDLEVQKIIRIPISDYIPTPSIDYFPMDIKNEIIQMPGYRLPSNDIMWGASAMMFNELVTLFNNSLT